MNYVIGRSKEELESINSIACSKNSYYESARKIFNKILDKSVEFIKSNAPVKELIICRYNYNSGKGVLYSENEMDYCLSIKYIPKGSTGFVESYKTILSFKMSSELLFILRSEGWKYVSSYPNGIYYYLDISRAKYL